MSRARYYRSMEEFEREEIRSHVKLGWSLDDLYQEANIERRDVDLDGDLAELDFERR